MRGEFVKQPVEELMERYQNNIYGIAFNVCKNAQDAEDVVQDTFIQYHTMNKDFDNENHIRAWLIRVAINKAKNMNRTFWRQNKVSLEDYMETLTFETPQSEEQHMPQTLVVYSPKCSSGSMERRRM